ncbi:MAG: N-acetyltransferase [bacterium]
MAKTKQADTTNEVLHDEDNGKFYIPYPDKQAVLRYSLDEDAGTVEFHSIFVPPSLREDDLADKIINKAYEWANEENLTADPETTEEFHKQNQDHV